MRGENLKTQKELQGNGYKTLAKAKKLEQQRINNGWTWQKVGKQMVLRRP